MALPGFTSISQASGNGIGAIGMGKGIGGKPIMGPGQIAAGRPQVMKPPTSGGLGAGPPGPQAGSGVTAYGLFQSPFAKMQPPPGPNPGSGGGGPPIDIQPPPDWGGGRIPNKSPPNPGAMQRQGPTRSATNPNVAIPAARMARPAGPPMLPPGGPAPGGPAPSGGVGPLGDFGGGQAMGGQQGVAQQAQGQEWYPEMYIEAGKDLIRNVTDGDPTDEVLTDMSTDDQSGSSSESGSSWVDSEAGIPGAAGEMAGDILSELAEGAGNAYTGFVEGWENANPPPGEITPQIQAIIDALGGTGNEQFLAGLQQFAGGLIDPAAWEQQAQNRFMQQSQVARGTMNDLERRLRGSAARGGVNPIQAGLSNVYNQYGQTLQDAERNIFNDALDAQMGAFGQAQGFGLGQQGQDLGMLQQQLQALIGGTQADQLWAQENYTSADEAAQTVAQLISSMMGGAGGAAQAGGSIASAIMPLIMGATSDRNVKHDIVAADERGVLERLRALPISRWRYNAESGHPVHLGPMAQDFHAAFGLGDDDTKIALVDGQGVALAAAKALAEENAGLRDRLAALERRLESIRG